MDDNKDVSDQVIIQRWTKAAESMSHYNAAEGPMWSQERAARAKAQGVFNAVNAELKSRGLTRPKGSYLI